MKDKILKVGGGCSLFIAMILILFFDMKNPFTAGFVVYFVLLSVILIFISIRKIDLVNKVEELKKENSAFSKFLEGYETDDFGPVFSSNDEKEQFYAKVETISEREADRYKRQARLRQCLKLVENESEEIADEFMDEAVGILKYLIRYHVYEEKEEWTRIKNAFFYKQEAFETNKIINKAEAFLTNINSKKDVKEALSNAMAIIQRNIDETPQNINREKIEKYLAELNVRFGNYEASSDTNSSSET